MDFKDQIAEFIPITERERNEKRVVEDYVKQFPDNILLRSNEFAHIQMQLGAM